MWWGLIEKAGGTAKAVQVDTSSEEGVKKGKDAIVSLWGKIDIVVNAPGVNSATPVFDIPEEEWNKILDTNLKGVFLSCRVFAKQMIDQKSGGSIINISSVSSGPPLSRVFTYSISKAGVNNMTRFLAKEWAPHKIRVNAIMPGFFPAEQNRKILTEERRKSIFAHTPWRDTVNPMNCRAHFSGLLPRRRRHSSPARSFRSTAGSRA